MDERGLDNTHLANHLGVCKSVVTYWLKTASAPKHANAKKLADLFGVPVSYFVFRSVRMRPIRTEAAG